MKTPSPSGSKPDELPQIEKFRDLAREVEADEDEKRFEDTVRKVAKVPAPKPEVPTD